MGKEEKELNVIKREIKQENKKNAGCIRGSAWKWIRTDQGSTQGLSNTHLSSKC